MALNTIKIKSCDLNHKPVNFLKPSCNLDL